MWTKITLGCFISFHYLSLNLAFEVLFNTHSFSISLTVTLALHCHHVYLFHVWPMPYCLGSLFLSLFWVLSFYNSTDEYLGESLYGGQSSIRTSLWTTQSSYKGGAPLNTNSSTSSNSSSSIQINHLNQPPISP